MDVRETTPDADDISLPEAKAAMRCAVQEEFGLSDEQTRLIGTQEDYDEVAVRFVTDPAGRRMWEFFVELDLDGTACSIGIYVNAANGEIVLLDLVTGGNGIIPQNESAARTRKPCGVLPHFRFSNFKIRRQNVKNS